LRRRPEDIPPLAGHFLRKTSDSREMRLTDGALRVLQAYPWPGNVRELANAMERVKILDPGDGVVTAEMLSFLRPGSCGQGEAGNFRLPPDGIYLETLQKDLVKQALEMTGENQSAAAKLLGLTRAKFRVLVKNAMDEE
jgi:DNA-binding NtrC family response regulator